MWGYLFLPFSAWFFFEHEKGRKSWFYILIVSYLGRSKYLNEVLPLTLHWPEQHLQRAGAERRKEQTVLTLQEAGQEAAVIQAGISKSRCPRGVSSDGTSCSSTLWSKLAGKSWAIPLLALTATLILVLMLKVILTSLRRAGTPELSRDVLENNDYTP